MVFEEIYREYWDKIYRLCQGYANDRDWAKDMTQETFVIVWQQLPHFRQESSVGTWIFRIACNNCLRQIEKENRFPRKELPADVSDRPDPDYSQELLFLQKCIAELGETDRLLIGLELENVPQAQIAVILGLSEANTRVRLHRIKDKIKQKFKSYEYNR
ncbi:MAG TPA: sigma-70 family RNA polymerase sigma factor [Puia sp.]|nr:sigma-70 family RNA polymerase sigma factor [Puia sp.]